jgi:hypothetical protein
LALEAVSRTAVIVPLKSAPKPCPLRSSCAADLVYSNLLRMVFACLFGCWMLSTLAARPPFERPCLPCFLSRQKKMACWLLWAPGSDNFQGKNQYREASVMCEARAGEIGSPSPSLPRIGLFGPNVDVSGCTITRGLNTYCLGTQFEFQFWVWPRTWSRNGLTLRLRG